MSSLRFARSVVERSQSIKLGAPDKHVNIVHGVGGVSLGLQILEKSFQRGHYRVQIESGVDSRDVTQTQRRDLSHPWIWIAQVAHQEPFEPFRIRVV